MHGPNDCMTRSDRQHTLYPTCITGYVEGKKMDRRYKRVDVYQYSMFCIIVSRPLLYDLISRNQQRNKVAIDLNSYSIDLSFQKVITVRIAGNFHGVKNSLFSWAN